MMTTKEPGETKQPEAEAAPKAEEREGEAAAKPEAKDAPPEPAKAEEAEAAPPATEPPPPTAAEPPPPPPLVAEERRDFWDTATTYLKKAKDEVVRSSRIGKLRLDIARVKKQRKDLFAELGEKTHELLSAQSLSAEALEELKISVDEKNALIAAKEAEIEAVAAEEAAEEEEAETQESS
ncbi:MAG: hypothetical protein ACE5H5_03740 [Nitrospinota bacterium]